MGKEAEDRIENSMRKLSEVIRDVKNAAADRDDVVVELREAQQMRLDLLVQELEPVLADIPRDDDLFDLTVSSGLHPRFWIDAVSHVTMGRDKRTYRFLKDSRLGRVVIGETDDVKEVADHVARYIAGRMIERDRMMDGAASAVDRGANVDSVAVAKVPAKRAGVSSFLEGLMIFLIGALSGLALIAALYWDRLMELGLKFWQL